MAKEEFGKIYENNISGPWESFYGDHLHEGFFDPGTTATITNIRAAKVRIIDEALRFANISDDPEKKPKSMLDVGCGIGGTCFHVAKNYDIKCRGINLSPDQVKSAQDLAAAQGLESKVCFDVGDAMDMPYPDGTFDLVLSIGCIEEIQDKEKFIREIVRVAAPGAPIIILSFALRNVAMKPEEQKTLNKLCDYLVLSQFCSSSDYIKWFTPLTIQGVEIEDWTQNVTPFYPTFVKEAFSWKGMISFLWHGGWSSMKFALGIKMLGKAADEGILKYVAVKCRKAS
jgi:tocopherol O-methyltransferase